MSPMHGRKNTMCCKQVNATASFNSYKNKRTFKLFHNLTCKRRFSIYLMERILCKLQYVGKLETPFTLCLINHRSDVFDKSAIPTYRHFTQDKLDLIKMQNLR